MKKIIQYIFKILLIAFAFKPASSQTINLSVVDSTGLVGFEELASKIESNNKINLFYKSEWFVGKKFRSTIANLPLNNCLNIIKRLTELNCIEVNSTTFVFVPVEIRNYTNKVNSKGVVLIGEIQQNENIKPALISGKIIDFETGKVLKNARINIDKLNLVAYTDNLGEYKITVPIGEYDIRLNYSDYKENTKTIRVSGNGIVDFELAEISILLREVVVTDKIAELNIMRTQMSVLKLNAKAIKKLPLFLGEKDIVKSVTLLPGIQSTGEFGTGFFVRGGGSDQNLILVEDVPIFNSSHLFGLNSAINSDGVSSISLTKGGIPAKYGERVSSVMDIKLGNNVQKAAIKGGLGLINSRLNLELPLFDNKVSFLIGGRSSYSNWLLHSLPDVELKKSSASFYDINTQLTIRPNSKNSLSLFGYFSNDVFSFSKNSPYHYDNTLASIRYNHTFNEKLYSSVIIGISRYRNDISQSDTLKHSDNYKISSKIDYKNSKINFTWIPTKSHTVDVGVNGALYNLQPEIMSPLDSLSKVITKKTNTENAVELSAYLSDNYEITKKIGAELGIRYTKYAYLGPNTVYSYSENAPRTTSNIIDTLNFNANEVINWYSSFEPRVSLRYMIDDVSSLKISYNRISQYINLISNTAVMAPTDVYKLSSPNVKPLICNQYAVGFFKNIDNNAYETSVELYYKKLNNIVEYRDGSQILLNNTLESDLLSAIGYNYGAEFFIKKNSGKLTGWISYTYSKSMRRTISTFELDQINNNKYYPSSFDKPHNLVINASYQLTKRWRMAGIFNYSTGKPVTLPELTYSMNGQQYVLYSDRNKYRLPDYHRLDFAITYDESLHIRRKWKGSWTLSVLNLYAQKNPYSVFYKSTSQLESQFHNSFNLYQIYIIARPIPTLSYNFSF